jgi:arylformamidase
MKSPLDFRCREKGQVEMTYNSVSIPKGRVVDLTHVLLPNSEQYTLEVSRKNERHGEEGDIMSTVYMWSHVGTHVEAPLHFLAKGGDTASLTIDQLMGPAIILDFRHKEVNEPITLEEMQGAGDIQVGDRVLTMTGRHTQYRTPKSHDRPYITEEAVRWLVEDRKIRCLGTDSSGFEVRGVTHHPNHRIINNAGIPVLECLANLVDVQKQRVFLIALAIPVKNLDAFPVRAIVIEPED